MGHQILIKAQQLCILKEGTWKIGKQQKQKGLTLLSNSIQRIQKSWGTEMIGQKPASIKLMERVKCGGKTKTVIARLWLWKERLELEINKNCITHESIHFAPNHKFCWLTGQLTAAKWGFSPSQPRGLLNEYLWWKKCKNWNSCIRNCFQTVLRDSEVKMTNNGNIGKSSS